MNILELIRLTRRFLKGHLPRREYTNRRSIGGIFRLMQIAGSRKSVTAAARARRQLKTLAAMPITLVELVRFAYKRADQDERAELDVIAARTKLLAPRARRGNDPAIISATEDMAAVARRIHHRVTAKTGKVIRGKFKR